MKLEYLSYDSLQEEFCVQYFRVYKKLPSNKVKLSKPNLIFQIIKLRKSK